MSFLRLCNTRSDALSWWWWAKILLWNKHQAFFFYIKHSFFPTMVLPGSSVPSILLLASSTWSVYLYVSCCCMGSTGGNYSSRHTVAQVSPADVLHKNLVEVSCSLLIIFRSLSFSISRYLYGIIIFFGSQGSIHCTSIVFSNICMNYVWLNIYLYITVILSQLTASWSSTLSLATSFFLYSTRFLLNITGFSPLI